MKYRNKSTIVEAHQTTEAVVVSTLWGDMKADIGDYIITYATGEKHSCSPDTFKKLYEVAE